MTHPKPERESDAETDDSITRRNALRTIGAAGAGVGGVGLFTGVASAGDVDSETVINPPGGGGGDGPFVMKEADKLNSTYNGHDYRAGVGVEGRYYGSFTNPNRNDGVWFHDFVMSGFSTARSRGRFEDSWNLDHAIDSQTAIIENNNSNSTAIVSTVDDSTTEWIGETHRGSDESNAGQYTDAMITGLKTVIGEVSEKVGYAIDAAEFIGALVNNKGDAPNSETWELAWNYGSVPSIQQYATDCGNTVRFAVTSPKLGDYIDITTKQQSNIPTVNSEEPPYPYSSLRWEMETTKPDGGSLSASDLSAYPSTTVPKSQLPPYEGLHEMAEHGSVERVMLPLEVTSSTSSL